MHSKGHSQPLGVVPVPCRSELAPWSCSHSNGISCRQSAQVPRSSGQHEYVLSAVVPEEPAVFLVFQ